MFGILIITRQPVVYSSSMQTSPPMRVTKARQRVSPIPMPGTNSSTFVNCSNTHSFLSCGIPGPVSLTFMVVMP